MCGMVVADKCLAEALRHKAAGSLLQLQAGMFYYGDSNGSLGFAEYEFEHL